MEKYFFLSYRSIEQDFALKLARDLLQSGHPVWMDRLHGILPGDEWRQSLEQGVRVAPVPRTGCQQGNRFVGLHIA